jgi:hypothetical protein
LRFFSSLFRASELNADPIQQKLADLLIEGCSGVFSGDVLIRSLVLRQNWPKAEEEDRINNAVTIAGTRRPDLYPELKRAGKAFLTWSSAG